MGAKEQYSSAASKWELKSSIHQQQFMSENLERRMSRMKLAEQYEEYLFEKYVYHITGIIDPPRLSLENGFSPESGQILFGVTACLSQVSPDDRNVLWALITFYGGDYQLSLNKKCTHLIVPEPKETKFEYAYQRENIKIVAPDWVVDSLSKKIRKDEEPYHLCLTYYEEEEEEEDKKEENEKNSQNASADVDRYFSKSSPASSLEASPLPDQETSLKRSMAAKIKEELIFDDSSPEKQERNLNWTSAEIPQMSTAKRRLPQGKDSG
ncbi:PAX-interacting protein 1-like [Ranitomeya imitator]|uniref:PAX-interacting protein 1-like n=1 Tax=Ranitomeya imitator TaxID=111125 RepID=UPI0037E9A6A7